MKVPGSTRLLPWLLMVFLAGALLLLYELSTQISGDERVRVELGIRQAMMLDTQINLDVLRLRNQQLLNYDTLVQAGNQMDQLLSSLQTDFEHMGLPNTLAGVQKSWANKAVVLDDFKRQNAVLSNSLYHFVNLSNKLNTWSGASAEDMGLLNAVSRDVLVMINGQQTRPSLVTQDALKGLAEKSRAWPESERESAGLMAAHGKLIVDSYFPVQNMVNALMHNPMLDDLEMAYGEYSRAYLQSVAKAEFFRQWMAGFALVMLAAAILILLRLQHVARALATSHSLLDNVTDHLGEGILSFDAEGKFNFINRRAELLLERSEQELLGQSLDILLPGKRGQIAPLLAALKLKQPFEGEGWLRRPLGDSFPAAFLGGPLPSLDEEGVPGGYVTSFRDITSQRQTEARLQLAARVFDSLSEAMTITDARGLIQSVNPAFTLITGYTEAEAIGRSPGALLASGMHDKAFYEAMWIGLRDEGRWQGEIFNRRKNGETYPEWLSITAVRDQAGEVMQYIALFSDTSERKQAEAYIHHLAYHDPLTGLANRVLFQDRLNNAIQQTHRTLRPLAVMIFDLDRFKSINDTLGHATGDVLLKRASERLSYLVPDGDTLARLGGDEFGLLLLDINSHADAATLASRMLAQFETPFELEGREVFVSTSVGIAVYPSDGDTAEVLLKHAEVALYNAKDAGRDTFRFFLESDSEHSLERLELETDLRRSVERDELRLHYQIQIHSQTGEIHGAEALVRWQHPVRGLLFPDQFISLAEATGYIDVLGRWCLETACHQLVEWQKMGLPIQRVAVNVSARQLRAPGFYEMVMEILKTSGLAPSCLEIELTESSLVEDAERTFQVFSLLRKQGVRIAIDDFGTGYSCLSYLSYYPVDVVKIDKSFVQNLGEEPETRSIVQAVTLLALALSMETVAEGVENEFQHRRLVELKCNLLQGYLFARPCPPEEIPMLNDLMVDENNGGRSKYAAH